VIQEARFATLHLPRCDIFGKIAECLLQSAAEPIECRGRKLAQPRLVTSFLSISSCGAQRRGISEIQIFASVFRSDYA
jgi:hypothetical protein